MKTSERKYVLKPGKHQFAPGSPAIHDNDNTSDKEAAWYLSKFPHIASLFETIPSKQKPAKDEPVAEEPVSEDQEKEV